MCATAQKETVETPITLKRRMDCNRSSALKAKDAHMNRNLYPYKSKSLAWLTSLVLASVMAGCGGGGDGGGTGVTSVVSILPGATCTASAGALIPRVTASDPTNGNLLVTTSTAGVAGFGKLITATFSLAMNPATLNSNPAGTLPTFTIKNNTTAGSNVTGTVAMNLSNTVATFTTAAALPSNSSFTATITTFAKSGAVPNAEMGCAVSWNFSTGLVATGFAPISLGLVGPFGLASAGGITNAGLSTINGDVVLNPNQTCNAAAVGAANDFGANCNVGVNRITNNAGDKVITQIFPDTTTADAVVADLNATWISINPANRPGATVLGCGSIGLAGGGGAGIGCAGNATLPPGTYISAAASTIDVTGILTLDAAGDANAVWVFQSPTALNMNVGSAIVLTGGAKASNVWWFVGSSATVFVGATANGNILASAAISLQNGATSCGRLLSGAAGAGALTMLTNTVSVPGHPNAPVGCQ